MTAEYVPEKLVMNGHAADAPHPACVLPPATCRGTLDQGDTSGDPEGRRVEREVRGGGHPSVGSMLCAYLFALMAFASLPATLVIGGFVPASAFPSLVDRSGRHRVDCMDRGDLPATRPALDHPCRPASPIVLVGRRAIQTYEDTVAILDKLDENTQGGITVILQDVREILASIPK